LHLHISQTNDIALIVMAHLPRDIDGVVDFDRLRVTVLFLPGHTKGFGLLLGCQFLSCLELYLQGDKELASWLLVDLDG